MKKINEKLKKVFESKFLVKILYGIGLIVIILISFSAGVSVGFHRASFGRAWGDNYVRNFGITLEPPIFPKDNFPNAHGAIGKIIKIELPNVIVADRDNTERVIVVNNDTKIEKIRNNITSGDLKIDDFIVVIGSPNEQGQIEAKFIRVIPSPDSLLNNPQTK